MRKSVVVIGAGINGLVAANYLARAGRKVTIIERKDHAGGACTAATCELGGKRYEYPQGASVFGFMEQFVFEETGLAKAVSVFCPEHPEIVYSGDDARPTMIWKDPEKLARELKDRWAENGDVSGFLRDVERVTTYVRRGYKEARVPTLQTATLELGEELTARWIAGSARSALNHYFTAEQTKLFYALSVIESGPVSFVSPYSAFSIPLMASGSVFGGDWGYVRGGIWQVPLALDQINAELGVERIFSARVVSVTENGTVEYEKDGSRHSISGDLVVFATDPATAAHAAGDRDVLDTLSREQLIGTSGKLILFFKQPARWKDNTGEKDFDSAFRFIIPPRSLEESEMLSDMAARSEADFTPGLFEIYPEGAGNRTLGGSRPYDLVSVFFKNLAFQKPGSALPEVRQRVMDTVLAKIENPEDCFYVILETPRDLSDWFFFPGGNIDDVELTEGQTFFQRTFSPRPEKHFYQFGRNPRFFYCAAGAYPCGSVAGTPGYMCAAEILRNH